jgi:hypothetical protein
MKKFILLLVFVPLFSCSNENNETVQKQQQEDSFESYKDQFNKQSQVVAKRLKGKKLDILDSAILEGSKPETSKSLIFLAKITDCSSCTSKAIEVLDSFQTLDLNTITVKIGYSEVGGYPNNFRYSFEDSQGSIQEKLGYFHTPTLILYGSEGIISSYLIPTYEDSTSLSNYIKTIYDIL